MKVVRVDFEKGERIQDEKPEPDEAKNAPDTARHPEDVLLGLASGRLSGNQQAAVINTFRTGELPEELPAQAEAGVRGAFLPYFARMLHDATNDRHLKEV